MLAIIVAFSEGQVIGKDNALPWHYPEDLRYFKKQTSNKTVVMGSKTYESIGKPLPNRHNVVITRNQAKYPELETYRNIEEFLEKYQNSDEEIFIIGGASIYQQFLPFVDRLYITYINKTYVGDTYFPEFSLADYEIINKEVSGELTFFVYERRVRE